MGKLEKIIIGCTISILGVTLYVTSLTIGYTIANHHKIEALSCYYKAIDSYGNCNKEEYEKYLELAIVHKQKGEKWEELTKSIDLFNKLDLKY